MSYLRRDTVEGQQLRELPPGEVMWRGTSNFGIPGNQSTGVAINNDLLARHMLFIGSIGSGKSVTLYHLIKGLRKNSTSDDVFIFFDAKGDYYEEFHQPGDVVLTNEVDTYEGTVYWNVFEDIMATAKDKRDEVIWEIAATIFQRDIETSTAPIFAVGARDLFAAILCSIVRDIENKGEQWDNEKLINWLQQATDVTIRNLLLNHKDLQWVRNYIQKENSMQTTQSFLMHLYQNLFSIFTGAFQKSGDFSITKTIQERSGKAIFLEYDIASANVLKPIYSLVLDIAMKNVLGQKEKDCKGNVFFILDEFPLIPKLNYMDNALNFGRSLGLRILAGVQNIGQIKHNYNEALGESIISGFGTIFAFRLFDHPSRLLITNRHGASKKMISYGSSNASKGVQDTLIDGKVIEDWDLTELTNGQCIVSPYNGEPFKFNPINYVTERKRQKK